jgi:hypothetical protein
MALNPLTNKELYWTSHGELYTFFKCVLSAVKHHKFSTTGDNTGFNLGRFEVCPMLYKIAPVVSGSLEWKFNVIVVTKSFNVGVLVSLCICVLRVSHGA